MLGLDRIHSDLLHVPHGGTKIIQGTATILVAQTLDGSLQPENTKVE